MEFTKPSKNMTDKQAETVARVCAHGLLIAAEAVAAILDEHEQYDAERTSKQILGTTKLITHAMKEEFMKDPETACEWMSQKLFQERLSKSLKSVVMKCMLVQSTEPLKDLASNCRRVLDNPSEMATNVRREEGI